MHQSFRRSDIYSTSESYFIVINAKVSKQNENPHKDCNDERSKEVHLYVDKKQFQALSYEMQHFSIGTMEVKK